MGIFWIKEKNNWFKIAEDRHGLNPADLEDRLLPEDEDDLRQLVNVLRMRMQRMIMARHTQRHKLGYDI